MLKRAVCAFAAHEAMLVSRFRGEPSFCRQEEHMSQTHWTRNGHQAFGQVIGRLSHYFRTILRYTAEALTSAPSLAAMKLACSWSSEKIMLPKSLVVVGRYTDLRLSRRDAPSWALTAPMRHTANRALQ